MTVWACPGSSLTRSKYIKKKFTPGVGNNPDEPGQISKACPVDWLAGMLFSNFSGKEGVNKQR